MRHIDLPDDVVRLAEAQVAAGRFASVEEVIRAGVEAIEHGTPDDQEWTDYARAAWQRGVESLDRDGPVLTTDAEFEAFLDECVTSPHP